MRFLAALGALSACALAACAKPNYGAPTALPTSSDFAGKPVAGQAKFASSDLLSYSWEKLPTEKDFGSFIFKTFRPNLADGSPVLEDLPGTMSVVLWMSMGHGSSPVSVQRLDVGTFRASKVFFSMSGQWEIHFQLKNGDAVADEAKILFTP